MKKILAFDMDGTIADLYGVKDWLPKLQAEDVSPYRVAEPLCDMEKLNATCELLQQAGWEIRIITAMAKNATPEYKEAIRAAKIGWLNKWGFIYDHFHGIDYKAKKHNVLWRKMNDLHGRNDSIAILIDDELRHRDSWKWGKTINPETEDIIEALEELLNS